MDSASTAETSTLGAEAVQLLSELLRFNTVNPPGNERPAQEHVAAILRDAGFEVELLEREPDRTNVIARLPGEAEGPILAYISHMDTVPADPDDWSFSPWSGEVVDGFVQGRGGQDMKDQVATEVAAAAHLARSGWRPARGELKVIIAADEELGANMGAKWLCEEHPEKVRADFVVNEGAGALFEIDGRRFYGVALGEKGVFRFKLKARGRAGPRIGPEPWRQRAPSPGARHLAPGRTAAAGADRGGPRVPPGHHRPGGRHGSTRATSSRRWPSSGASRPKPPPTWRSRCSA